MPQFNLANFPAQIAWLALFFAILYFVIVRATLPKLGRVIDNREGKIAGDIAAADTADTDAARVREGYEAEMAAAHARAHEAVNAAKEQSTRDTEGRLGTAKDALDTKQVAALDALEASRARATDQIERIAADATAEIVQRLTGARPDAAEARAAARAALAA